MNSDLYFPPVLSLNLPFSLTWSDRRIRSSLAQDLLWKLFLSWRQEKRLQGLLFLQADSIYMASAANIVYCDTHQGGVIGRSVHSCVCLRCYGGGEMDKCRQPLSALRQEVTEMTPQAPGGWWDMLPGLLITETTITHTHTFASLPSCACVFFCKLGIRFDL